MSRKIDLTKPLSDEDRQYLEDRAMHREIAEADGNTVSTLPDDSVMGAFGQDPNAVPAAGGAPVMGDDGTPVNPDGSAATVQGSSIGAAQADSDEEDNYDDESAWSYDDVKEEVKERREAQGEDYDGPALTASREDLVSWLRSDDTKSA